MNEFSAILCLYTFLSFHSYSLCLSQVVDLCFISIVAAYFVNLIVLNLRLLHHIYEWTRKKLFQIIGTTLSVTITVI